MKKPDKNFDTGLRILEVLRILLEQDVTKGELIEKMNDNPLFENVYTFEAFIKYFNTLSIMGFKIDKDKNIYKLKNAFKQITLTEDEKDVFRNLIYCIKKLHNKTLEEKIKKVIYKSVKYIDNKAQKEIIKALEESSQRIEGNNIADTLETLIYDKRFLSITYIKNNNTQETITVQLKEIIEKKNDIILVCYDHKKARNKKINAASVISITQTPNVVTESTLNNDSVIFRLYGRLAQVYKLKEGETVLDYTSGYTTISNKGEDRDIIMKRLLKYGENCTIVQPTSLKEDFLAMTDNILMNLQEGVISCQI